MSKVRNLCDWALEVRNLRHSFFTVRRDYGSVQNNRQSSGFLLWTRKILSWKYLKWFLPFFGLYPKDSYNKSHQYWYQTTKVYGVTSQEIVISTLEAVRTPYLFKNTVFWWYQFWFISFWRDPNLLGGNRLKLVILSRRNPLLKRLHFCKSVYVQNIEIYLDTKTESIPI